MRTTTSQGRWVPIGLMVAALTGCAMSNTDSPVQTPGRAKASDTEMLEVGAQWLQDKPPIRALNMYLDGFHFTTVIPARRWKRTTTARRSTKKCSSV